MTAYLEAKLEVQVAPQIFEARGEAPPPHPPHQAFAPALVLESQTGVRTPLLESLLVEHCFPPDFEPFGGRAQA